MKKLSESINESNIESFNDLKPGDTIYYVRHNYKTNEIAHCKYVVNNIDKYGVEVTREGDGEPNEFPFIKNDLMMFKKTYPQDNMIESIYVLPEIAIEEYNEMLKQITASIKKLVKDFK